MDAFNYVLFKNPIVTYSVAAVKYAAVSKLILCSISGLE